MRIEMRGVTVAVFGLLVGACDLLAPEPPGIVFEPYAERHSDKPDFARVESRHPLSVAQRSLITPEYLTTLEQEQVEQIYARLTAGPIPDGPFDGDLFFPKGSGGSTRIAEIIGGLKGLLVSLEMKKLDLIGEVLWKGKVFYRDAGLLRNRIGDVALLAPVIDGPLSQVEQIDIDGEETWLLFPAKVYCGQSLLDGRRESIIIDYAFNDEIDGYLELPDGLVGRRGFRIRDEIRMVRPGFYLGRAYVGRLFALNFTLYSESLADAGEDAFLETGRVAEDCWPGTQGSVRMAS